MKALIDADRFCYMYGNATMEGSDQPLSWPFVVSRLDSSISNILEALDTDDYELYLTDSASNFRLELATILPYKGHRPPTKPFYYDRIKQFLIEQRGALLCRGIEADDQLGIDQCSSFDVKYDVVQSLEELQEIEDYLGKQSSVHSTCIVSVDKDLDMIPGWHYNPMKKEKYFVDGLQGLQFFYKQMLTGDTTDNIPGLYNVGEKSAHCKKIDECTNELEMLELVYGMYYKYFGEYAHQFLLENAGLLWIIREEISSDYPEDEIEGRLSLLFDAIESER